LEEYALENFAKITLPENFERSKNGRIYVENAHKSFANASSPENFKRNKNERICLEKASPTHRRPKF
jgi:hypothetical protein